MTAHNTMSAPVNQKDQPAEEMFRNIGDTVEQVSGGATEEESTIEDPQIIDHIGIHAVSLL